MLTEGERKTEQSKEATCPSQSGHSTQCQAAATELLPHSWKIRGDRTAGSGGRCVSTPIPLLGSAPWVLALSGVAGATSPQKTKVR